MSNDSKGFLNFVLGDLRVSYSRLSFFLHFLFLVKRCLRLCRSSWRGGSRSFFTNSVLLEGTHEGSLVSRRLEAPVTKFGGRVDELQVDLLQGSPLGVHSQGLKTSIQLGTYVKKI